MAGTVTRTSNSQVALPAKVQELKTFLANISADSKLGGSSAAIIADIQNRILNATTVDEVFAIANQGADSVHDWVDKPIEITEFRVLASGTQYQSDYGLDAYLAIAFTDLTTGEQKVLTAGGTILVTMLVKMYQADAFPLQCAFTETHTSAGFDVHKLRPLTDFERSALEKAGF